MRRPISHEVQYPYGSQLRICGGHKREGGCALPGEVCRRSWRQDRAKLLGHCRETGGRTDKRSLSSEEGNPHREVRLSRQKSAEGIVGGLDPAEGPNMSFRTGV